MTHTSAINWDYLSPAQRLQEKLRRYFALVEQIRALEEDPELQAALAALGGIADKPSAMPTPASPSETALPTPTLKALEEQPVAAPAARPRTRSASERLLALADPGSVFDAHFLLARAQEQGLADLAAMSPRNANDHLRRLANAKRIRLVTPGKRGTAGLMPFYRLVTEGTSAAEPAIDVDDL